MKYNIFAITLCFFPLLLNGCDTVTIDEINENKKINDEQITKLSMQIAMNLQEQKEYINKMQYNLPTTFKTIDDKMAEIADRIDGFAGYYVELKNPEALEINISDIEYALEMTKGMTHVIHMTNPDAFTPSLQTELIQALSQVYNMDSVMSGTTELIIRPAKYNIRQLQDWLRNIRDHDKMNSLRIDEKNNRIEVRVSTSEYIGIIHSQLIRSGIPEDALSVIIKEPVKLNSNSITDYYRPVIGGLEINRVVSPSPTLSLNNCTIGFTALINDNPYFVTNSHCSEEPFNTDSGVMYQVYPSAIGYEYYDQPLYPNCPYPFGSKCRLSDASLYRFYSGIQYNKKIAFPETSGGLFFNQAKPVISLSSPPQYSPIFKVGRTTGTQAGIIFDTCESRKATDGIWRLCSIESTLDSSGGDSGAPVFILLGEDIETAEIGLYGIHWGSTSNRSYASAIPFILSDLGIGYMDIVF